MALPTPDEVVLGLLTAQTRHGYHLLEAFRDPDQLGRIWTLSTSQIYAVLKRLEHDGLIVGNEVSTENAPPRIEYTVTAAGSAALDTWLTTSHPAPSIRRVRVEFLSRLYITRLLERPVETIIAAQRAACQAERARLLSEAAGSEMGLLANELVIAQLDAVIGWIDHCERLLSPLPR